MILANGETMTRADFVTALAKSGRRRPTRCTTYGSPLNADAAAPVYVGVANRVDGDDPFIGGDVQHPQPNFSTLLRELTERTQWHTGASTSLGAPHRGRARLHFRSGAVDVHTVEVMGSSPVVPTAKYLVEGVNAPAPAGPSMFQVHTRCTGFSSTGQPAATRDDTRGDGSDEPERRLACDLACRGNGPQPISRTRTPGRSGRASTTARRCGDNGATSNTVEPAHTTRQCPSRRSGTLTRAAGDAPTGTPERAVLIPISPCRGTPRSSSQPRIRCRIRVGR